LLVSNPQLPSAGTTAVDLTAVVLDANGQSIPGTVVTFSTGADPSAFTSSISGSGSPTRMDRHRKLNVGATSPTAPSRSRFDVGRCHDNQHRRRHRHGITISGNSSMAFGAQVILHIVGRGTGSTSPRARPCPGVGQSRGLARCANALD